MKVVIRIQSLIDLITNSSTEVYTKLTSSAIIYVKEIIDSLLSLGNSGKTCDDLFEVSQDLREVVDRYKEYLYEDLRELYGDDTELMQAFWDMITEQDCKEFEEKYSIEGLESFQEYLDTTFNGNCHDSILIMAKDPENDEVAKSLSLINSLFHGEECWD